MDAYHKILVKIRDITGGKETVDVDMVELTRKEGYFPSLDGILDHLKTEGWVTESRPNTVRITHWGNAEAKKAGIARPDAARAVERESKRLLAETRDLAVVIEEFIADPSSKRFASLKTKFSEMESLIAKINEAL